MLQIEARRTGLFQVSPSQVEISEVECITIPATAATKSSDDPPLVDATTPPIYQGGLNFVDCQTGVTGWVWDVNRQDSAVTVAVYDGETVVATGLANQFREDLPLAGKGHGRYAFQIPLPPHLRDGQPHPIRVAIADSQRYFNQQPVLVNCSP